MSKYDYPQKLGPEFCSHGNLPPCEACKVESKKAQPAWQTIERLQQKSKFKRSNSDSPNTEITEIEVEGKKFKVETVESKDSPVLTEVQQLFEKTFGEEEVDPEKILRAAVAGETPFGTKDEVKYKVIVVKDEADKVVSTVAGGHLDLLDNNGQPTGETMLMIGYAVTDRNTRQGGLAREAYISTLIDAANEAQSQGKKFNFAAGECTFTSEEFWNKVGWKRVYARTGDRREYTELPYIQPALEFDETTGDVAEGAGAAPEHLMIDSFERRPPDKEKIVQTVRAFYRWCNTWPKSAFKNEQAYDKHLEYVNKIAAEFKRFTETAGQLIYLDQVSRTKAVEKKVLTIQEHSAADHGRAGDEDF